MARLFYVKKQKHLKNQNNNVKIYLQDLNYLASDTESVS